MYSLERILWWLHVTVSPEVNKIVVLSRGTPNALNVSIPVGGQTSPTSTVGESLMWKYAQKKEKKNITSEVMNKIIPHRILFWTEYEWCPWRVASRLTSRHHWVDVKTIVIMPNAIAHILFE